MSALTRLGTIAAAVLLAACTTSPSPPPNSPAPSPTPLAPVNPIVACVPGQVRLTAGNVGAAAGTSILTFTAWLADGPPCLVATRPGVLIRSAVGEPLVEPPVDLNPVARTAVLVQSLEYHLGWASACKPLPAGPYIAQIDLFEGDHVNLELPAGFGPSGCMGAAMSVYVEPAFEE